MSTPAPPASSVGNSIPVTATEPQAARTPLDDTQRRNFWLLAWYHVNLRTGWIFKTESVIIPAFLDSIAGAPWIRGCLPWLNRVGQSVPPLFYADRLRRSAWKKRTLIATTLLMSVPFLVLSLLLFLSESVDGAESVTLPVGVQDTLRGALPWLFLGLYLVFFSTTGLSQLAWGTVQGKLVPADRRGGVLFFSGVFGSIFAIAFAAWLLPQWLARADGGFCYIFLFTGCMFVASSVWIMLLHEAPDESLPKPRVPVRPFRAAWLLLGSDSRFRRTVVVGVCFVSGLFLFPHYQALGRLHEGFSLPDLLGWVIAQNVGAGVCSVVAGPIADRFGNRITLRVLVAATAIPPLVSLLLTFTAPELARGWYWTTFFLLGSVPITFRTLTNYTLELCPPEDHPKYLSTLKLCMAVPFCLSPLVGACVGWFGFPVVFLSVTGVILTGVVVTFALDEPRHSAVSA